MREAGWVEAACKVKGLWADMPGLSDWIRLQVEVSCGERGSLGGERIGPGGQRSDAGWAGVINSADNGV